MCRQEEEEGRQEEEETQEEYKLYGGCWEPEAPHLGGSGA